ncbi:hypothetical protein BC936DRAFT_141414 [Jimgerdemannia flammicorona]|nr:hypothetical protein BC936DRAFT_141414 [Jimgerdemannia flammicorona]
MNQLEPFIRHFPASQLLVVRSEDFIADPANAFRRVARFLGIDDGVYQTKMYVSDEEFFGDQATGAGMAALNGDSGVGGSGYWNGKKAGNGAKKLVVAMAMEDSSKEVENVASSEGVIKSEKSGGKEESPSLDDDMKRRLNLATRYRLQKVFRPLNKRLIEMFEGGERDFRGWEYDVDRG